MTSHRLHKPGWRAVCAAFFGAVGGIAFAVISIVSPQGLQDAPWGLMVWGAPIGISAGAAVGLATWVVTHLAMRQMQNAPLPVRALLAVIPVILGIGGAYLSFGFAHSGSVSAVSIAAALGLLCGVSEIVLGGRVAATNRRART
jgi:hypothetical protein